MESANQNFTPIKNLKILLLIVTFGLKADFIAFRKMVHPTNQNTVYLLYDIHVSLLMDEDLIKQLLDKVFYYIKQQASHFTHIDTSSTNDLLYRYALTAKDQLAIEGIIEPALQAYPNLIKQQQDLLNIINNCKISLVNEDWVPIILEHSRLGENKFGALLMRYLGEPYSESPEIRESLTPMHNIGKKITGKFSTKELIRLPLDNYYFNTEIRGSYFSGTPNNQMDKLTISAIQTLFDSYDQSAVIVSEGLEHIQNIEARLATLGYKKSALVVNPNLIQLARTNLELRNLLHELETGKKITDDSYLYSKDGTLSLAKNPIDLQEVFAPELAGTCIPRGVSGQRLDGKQLTPAGIEPMSSDIKGQPVGVNNLARIELILHAIGRQYNDIINLSLTKKSEELSSIISNLSYVEKILQYLGYDYKRSVELDFTTKIDLVSHQGN